MLVIHPSSVDKLTDKTIIDKLIHKDPSLTIVFETVNPKLFKGLPKPPYVALIGAVIGQIIRYTQAKYVRSKLYELCGNNFTINDIEQITESQWSQIGIGPDKTEIIKTINRYIRTNNINLRNIYDIKKLKSIKGIGEWTINTTILTSFMNWDTFPHSDLFIRKKIKKLYAMKKLPTIAKTKEIAILWKPHRSIVAWYLWRWFD